MALPVKNSRVQELETLGILAAFFLILNIFTHKQAFVYAAVALLLIALFIKPLSELISRLWLKFAEALGTLNSKVILSLVFFLFLTPLAFLYRLFAKNPLSLKNNGMKSFYTDRNHVYTSADLEKMW